VSDQERQRPHGPWVLIYAVSATVVVLCSVVVADSIVDRSFALFLLAFGVICALLGLPIMRWVAVRIDRASKRR
jgi:hypothetical protein